MYYYNGYVSGKNLNFTPCRVYHPHGSGPRSMSWKKIKNILNKTRPRGSPGLTIILEGYIIMSIIIRQTMCEIGLTRAYNVGIGIHTTSNERPESHCIVVYYTCIIIWYAIIRILLLYLTLYVSWRGTYYRLYRLLKRAFTR